MHRFMKEDNFRQFNLNEIEIIRFESFVGYKRNRRSQFLWKDFNPIFLEN